MKNDSLSAIEALQELRRMHDALVIHRRDVLRFSIGWPKWYDDLRDTQARIDAVDRAIEDEQRLAKIESTKAA
jgi:hypothetical protein